MLYGCDTWAVKEVDVMGLEYNDMRVILKMDVQCHLERYKEAFFRNEGAFGP